MPEAQQPMPAPSWGKARGNNSPVALSRIPPLVRSQAARRAWRSAAQLMTMSHHHDASARVINPGKTTFPTGRGESEAARRRQ